MFFPECITPLGIRAAAKQRIRRFNLDDIEEDQLWTKKKKQATEGEKEREGICEYTNVCHHGSSYHVSEQGGNSYAVLSSRSNLSYNNNNNSERPNVKYSDGAYEHKVISDDVGSSSIESTTSPDQRNAHRNVLLRLMQLLSSSSSSLLNALVHVSCLSLAGGCSQCQHRIKLRRTPGRH